MASYTHVLRRAREIEVRPAVQRGRRINLIWGKEELQLPERYEASDFDRQTQWPAPRGGRSPPIEGKNVIDSDLK